MTAILARNLPPLALSPNSPSSPSSPSPTSTSNSSPTRSSWFKDSPSPITRICAAVADDLSFLDLDREEPATFDGRRRRPVQPSYPFDHAYLNKWIATCEPSEKQLQQHRVFCVPLPELDGAVHSTQPRESQKRPRPGSTNRLLITTMTTTTDANMGDEQIHSVHGPVSGDADTPSELSFSKTASSTGSYPSAESLSEYERDSKATASTHFEDLSLADTERGNLEDSNVKAENRPTLKRRTTRDGEVGRSTPVLPLAPSRDGILPKYINSKGPMHGAGAMRDQSLNLPNGRMMRRGFSSPSAPTLSMRTSSFGISSRSPSPGNRSATSTGSINSPHTFSGTTPRPSSETRKRQNSWQPGRKTVEELEAEYNDEDEEVPDEAILENVPISPMPGMPSPITQLRAQTPSPHRRASHNNLLAAHGNLHSANVPKNAKRPSLPTVLPNGRFATVRSPRRAKPPRLSHSASMTHLPSEAFAYKHRSKSWSEDLNEEARQLSLALEEYSADRTSEDKRHSGQSATSSTASTTNSPRRPSVAKLRAKTSILEMAQMQKGSIMIDPLPISKEKEAVLTRTRPSWLPPKCQKEERKHMKQWEQMMARAQEAERKRNSREKEEFESKEMMQGSIAKIWDQHVLPHWDQVINEPRTRELWWRGVTPRSRAEVWLKALGNELSLTSASFEAALRRANELEETVAEMPDEERATSTEAAWLAAIARDVPTVLPEQKIYQEFGPLHSTLTDVLKAYAMYRRDVGYVYGTHLVAGMLCLHLRASEAFIALANLLNRPLPLAFLVHDTAAMSRGYALVLSTLKYKCPSLHDHLTSPAMGLHASDILDPLFRCLFAKNLPVEHASRIWDLFVFEGDRALIRSAVAVLCRLEHRLYGDRKAILDVLGWGAQGMLPVGTEDEFIKAVREAGKIDGTSTNINNDAKNNAGIRVNEVGLDGSS
ncbi:Hypothetical protein R9X50_00667900 [Acrodontium crateriforme]|uniref:Rab-GAP TBC domain-containing protein n=1 Tax=Acrodontium crateriforme TaxID=150365 RepID=A0AAQ3RBQ4_9PEZI|nr:Hypothetical protein R9X50_00667900 [Acrodontium crateriforme]